MIILLKIITKFLQTNTLSKVEPNTDLLSGISEDSSVSMRKKCLFETRCGKQRICDRNVSWQAY